VASLNHWLLAILLKLLLQVRDLSDLTQSLLLQMRLKYFELLLSHSCSNSELGAFSLQSFDCFFKVVDLNRKSQQWLVSYVIVWVCWDENLRDLAKILTLDLKYRTVEDALSSLAIPEPL